VKWTAAEKQAIDRQLGRFVTTMKVPGRLECIQAISKEPVLRNRTWKNVKYNVYNRICGMKRRFTTKKS
jgi:hypothetical protein